MLQQMTRSCTAVANQERACDKAGSVDHHVTVHSWACIRFNNSAVQLMHSCCNAT